jgi:hypothetical protein
VATTEISLFFIYQDLPGLPMALSALWQRESLFDEQGLLRVWGVIVEG